jgi:DNA-binding transcriptional regulator YiaG
MAAGQPTKYTKRMLNKAKQWIANFEFEYDSPVTTTTKSKDKKGEEKEESVEEMKQKVNLPPFISDLAKHLNVSRDTIYEWQKKHPEFSDTIKKDLKNKFEEVLVKNALLNRYSPAFAIFTAKNCIGWKDKQEISGDPDRPLITVIKRVIVKNGT